MSIMLFDIDGTLFDPKKFGSLYRADLAAKFGVAEDNLYSTIADYYSTLETSTDLDPNQLISYLASKFSVDEKEIADIFWNPKHFDESRFDDAKDTLKRLSQHYSLGVFSQGLRYYQEYKLEHSGLLKYFNSSLIFVYKRKMAQEASAVIPKGSIIVEDKHDVALHLSKLTKTIWLNRQNDEKDFAMETIHSLRDLRF